MKALVFAVNLPRIALTKALSPLSRSVFYSRLSALTCTEMREPVLPGDRWVKVRTRMCGICGSDLHLITLRVHPMVSLAALPKHVPKGAPKYLGHEAVGEVVEAGSGVSGLKIGDSVALASGPACEAAGLKPICTFCQEGSRALCQNRSELKLPADMGGGWSEYFVAHESQLFRVPEKLTDTEAALLEPTACSIHAVRRRVPRRGEHVLVVGAGPIGLNAIQAANLFCPECSITALVKYPFQAEVARSMGAQHVVFSRARDLYEQIADLTSGKVYTGKFGNKVIVGGFDVVYDCVGSAGTLKDDLRWVKTRGSVVVVGSLLEIGPFDYTPLWNQEITLLGSEAHGVEVVDGEMVTTFALAARLIAEGKLNVSPLLTHRFRLAEYREAMKTLMIKGRSAAIKAAFIF